MWNADGEVIQIEASPALYSGPPETIQLTQLGATEVTDLPCPAASLTSSEGLAAGVVVFFGLEELHSEVASLHQLGPLLQEKHLQICQHGQHGGGSGPLLDLAFGKARHGDWTGAIEASSWAYYLARIHGHVETVILALNIAGSVELHVDAMQGALRLTCAAHLANAGGEVADGLATQVNINAGYALLSIGSPDQALSCFVAATARAQAHGSEMQVVLACVGGAEAADQIGDHETATRMLGLCRQIAGPHAPHLPEPLKVIDESLVSLHRHFSGEEPAHPNSVTAWFEQLKTGLLAFGPVALFGNVMFHLGGGRGRSSALISIGATSHTSFGHAVFEAATAIGEHSKILLEHPL